MLSTKLLDYFLQSNKSNINQIGSSPPKKKRKQDFLLFQARKSLSKLPSSPRAVFFFWFPLGASTPRAQTPSRRLTDCRCIYVSRRLAASRPQKITVHHCRAPDRTVCAVFFGVALSTSPPCAQTTSRRLAMCLFVSPHRCVPTNHHSESLGVRVSMRLFHV